GDNSYPSSTVKVLVRLAADPWALCRTYLRHRNTFANLKENAWLYESRRVRLISLVVLWKENSRRSWTKPSTSPTVTGCAIFPCGLPTQSSTLENGSV